MPALNSLGYPKGIQNLFQSAMVRRADMEITVMKEEVYTHRSLETGGTACHTGPREEAPELARRQRELW